MRALAQAKALDLEAQAARRGLDDDDASANRRADEDRLAVASDFPCLDISEGADAEGRPPAELHPKLASG